VTDFPESDVLGRYPHPQNALKLYGQADAEVTFLSNYNSGRFHHAWLITGAKGVGKATFAYRAAKFLLSEAADGGLFGTPDSLDTNQDDPAISLIRAGSHPGLAVLKRKYDPKGKKLFSVIRVDDVRSLTNFFRMTSSEGNWRVVIIDTIDEMNNNAANALLKILEEPPEKTVFLIISHTPAGLLPTIRSRCRQLSLNPLNDEDLNSVLSPYISNLDEQKVSMLFSLAEGSPGKALQILDSEGLEIYKGILDIFRSYPRLDTEKLHGLADISGRKDGEGVYKTICELYPWLLSRLVVATNTQFKETSLTPDEIDIMRRMTAATTSPTMWIDLWEKGNQLINRARSVNLDRKQVVLNLFLNVERVKR
jgi:DNA polymerase III subunit delta'